jgi:hypothetical protein
MFFFLQAAMTTGDQAKDPSPSGPVLVAHFHDEKTEISPPVKENLAPVAPFHNEQTEIYPRFDPVQVVAIRNDQTKKIESSPSNEARSVRNVSRAVCYKERFSYSYVFFSTGRHDHW